MITLPHAHATPGSDYEILSNQTVHFGGGRSTNVRINIINDSVAEATETFTVMLSTSSSSVGVSGGDTVNVTIHDIDSE